MWRYGAGGQAGQPARALEEQTLQLVPGGTWRTASSSGTWPFFSQHLPLTGGNPPTRRRAISFKQCRRFRCSSQLELASLKHLGWSLTRKLGTGEVSHPSPMCPGGGTGTSHPDLRGAG